MSYGTRSLHTSRVENTDDALPSQSALYQQLIAAEFDKFKNHKETLANTNDSQRPYNQLYYRNLVSSINPTSGAWLSAGMSHPSFILSSFEFMAAMCRRNTTPDTSIPEYNRHVPSDTPQNYQCSCDGPIKTIDGSGYHFTGCKEEGNAIRLHDNAVHTVVTLFRSIGLSVALEPLMSLNSTVPPAPLQSQFAVCSQSILTRTSACNCPSGISFSLKWKSPQSNGTEK